MPADRAALVIEYRAPGELTPYAKNSRTHAPDQIAQIAASITEYGFTNPVLADEKGIVIAGHGRLLAAAQLGLAQIPVIVIAGLTAAQRKALVIADNKIALGAAWDGAILRAELIDLKESGFSMDLSGFTALELTDLFAVKEGRTDPDYAPPALPIGITKLGEVWLLGPHRLMCGDCTDSDTVSKVLAGAKPHLMVTDPPYGVDYDPSWRGSLANAWGKPRGTGLVENDTRADWTPAWKLFTGDVAYVWCASMFNDVVIASLEAAGFERRAQLIWRKPHFAVGRGHYHWQHEPLWYAVKKGGTGHWQGDRKQSTVWDIVNAAAGAGSHGEENKTSGHGTQKPVECMKRPMENNSKPGEGVYEPFCGSGSTIIAAEMSGRICYALEIMPPYIDMAVKRWQNFTGKAAVLESTGETFAQVDAQRQSAAA